MIYNYTKHIFMGQIMPGHSQTQKNIIKDQLIHHVGKIHQALTHQNQELATQTFIDFGAFLQEQYPGLGLDELRKKIHNLEMEFVAQELPDLQLVANLSEARIELYGQVANCTPVDKNAIYKLDALLKGLNLFAVVLGEKHHKEALGKTELPQQNDIDAAQQWINNSQYKISPIVTKHEQMNLIASNAVTELRILIKQTLEQLKPKVTESQTNPGEPSAEIKLAIDSINALELLQKTLSKAGSAKQRLERFQNKLNEEPIKNALNSNADDLLTKFLKILSYIKSFFSRTPYQGSPIRSEQQQALKEALSILKKTEKAGVIPPSPNIK